MIGPMGAVAIAEALQFNNSLTVLVVGVRGGGGEAEREG